MDEEQMAGWRPQEKEVSDRDRQGFFLRTCTHKGPSFTLRTERRQHGELVTRHSYSKETQLRG